jgi:uncharacterized protein (TIGR03083 family)
MEPDARVWIAALRGSHDRLAALVTPLNSDQIRQPSYCSGWSIAQVLSHLGSGAEIAMLMLPAALGQGELDRGAFPPIWDVWNGKSPDQQAADAVTADERQVQSMESLTADDLAKISFPFLGVDLDAAGLVGLRLGEHALHSWDIAVASDPAAVVHPDSVALLTDNVPAFIAPRLGQPQGEPLRYRIITTGPDRDYLLTVTDRVSMTGWPSGAEPATEIRMPAEALLRLSYGRLDAGHTPAEVRAGPADLDRLRKVFPGF